MPRFVDTNILVYAEDVDEKQKRPVALDLVLDLWRSRQGVVSVQVLQELFVTLTRKVRRPLPHEHAVSIVEQYATWRLVNNTGPLLRHAFSVMRSTSLSFWDALVVAAALEARCDVLYTEDLNPGQVIGGVRVVDPFRE